MSPSVEGTGLSTILQTEDFVGLTPTAVYFGGLPANGFTFNGSTGVISATAPAIPPGETVQVSVVLSNGVQIASPVPYSSNAAYLQVVGPRPFYPNTGGDGAWIGGDGHTISFAAQSISVTSSSPVFYVSTAFTGGATSLNYTPPKVLGNLAGYTVEIQMCLINAGSAPTPVGPPAGSQGPCTDYANHPGYWVVVSDASATLPIPAQQSTVWGILPITATNVVDATNLVRTLRFILGVTLNDTNDGAGNLIDVEPQQPFTIVYAPTQLVQLKVKPFAILYSPPGDASTATFKITNSYSVDEKVTNGTKMSASGTTQAAQAVKASFTAGVKSYESVGVNLGESWDTGTVSGSGSNINNITEGSNTQLTSISYQTVANYDLIPGTGLTCSSATNCSTLVPAPATMIPPYLNDIFILTVHPQYAVWSFAPGNTQYLLLAAEPGFALADAASLSACASGIPPAVSGIDPCLLNYAETQAQPSGDEVVSQGVEGAVTLTPTEAGNLLKLDPFFAQGSQNPTIAATRGLLLHRTSYGGIPGNTQPSANGPVDVAGPVVQASYVNTMATTTTAGTETDYTAGVTSTMQSTLGLSEAASAIFIGWDDSWAGTNTTTSTSSTTLSYADSTAVSSSLATEADVALQDYDNTMMGANSALCSHCHGPLNIAPSVIISLDRTFGGFMFQDPNSYAPSSIGHHPLSGTILQTVILANLVNQEQPRQRFPDVPVTNAANAAIGIMSRSKIIPGYPDGTFRPTVPITRAQFAGALARALSLPQIAKVTFTDVSGGDAAAVASVVKAGLLAGTGRDFSPDSPVSEREMAAAIAKGFGVAVSAPPDLAPGPAATVTRGQAATWLLAAMASRGRR